MFVHMAEFSKEEDKKIEDTIQNVEGKEYLQYEWIDLNEIEKNQIKPDVIKEVLKKGKFPVHKINID